METPLNKVKCPVLPSLVYAIIFASLFFQSLVGKYMTRTDDG